MGLVTSTMCGAVGGAVGGGITGGAVATGAECIEYGVLGTRQLAAKGTFDTVTKRGAALGGVLGGVNGLYYEVTNRTFSKCD